MKQQRVALHLTQQEGRPPNANDIDAAPGTLRVPAADGYELGGFVWRQREPRAASRPVVIINAATSVRCRYYARFAAYLFEHGFDVITYDYRGIGESRPPALRGFRASWLDWGRLDFEGVLRYTTRSFPDQPIHVVGHSVGGFVLGLAPSNTLIRRVFTMGAQFAYWRDYAPKQKWRMFLAGHVFMPIATALLGYFPAKRLGWFEDTPKGVVRDWWRLGSKTFPESKRQAIMQPCAAVTAPILALSVTDDAYGTVAAIERLLKYFTGSSTMHLRISPEQVGADAIGHFAFFSDRFERSLWPIARDWLQSGRVPGHSGELRVELATR